MDKNTWVDFTSLMDSSSSSGGSEAIADPQREGNIVVAMSPTAPALPPAFVKHKPTN